MKKDLIRQSGIRGTENILDATCYYNVIESFWRISKSYGVCPVKLSSIQPAEWFTSTSGEVSDICMKEMMSVARYHGDSTPIGVLTPEFTGPFAKILGKCGGVGHLASDRFAYVGSAYRYNRPQAGRLREFTQCGWEFFGDAGSEIEVMCGMMEWLGCLGVKDLVLRINNLGTADEQKKYADLLVRCLSDQNLGPEVEQKLSRSPLRVLDVLDPEVQVPSISEMLGAESKSRFDSMCKSLDEIGIDYTLDTRLVRGLDYYQGLVFEVFQSDSDRALAGGGRYDRITTEWGPTHAVGWAAGIERVLSACADSRVDLPALLLDVGGVAHAQCAAIRAEGIPVSRYIVDYKNIKKCFAKADKARIRLVLVIGEDETSKGILSWKDLRTSKSQSGSVLEFVDYYKHNART
jgi:histidyl-tRNA synthetase